MATLILNNVTFPNSTVIRNWFPHEWKKFISALSFVQIPILTIAEHAFENFIELRKIEFKHIDSLSCVHGWSRGISVIYIIFNDASIRQINYNFFVNCSVQYISMYNSSKNINIVNMFGIGIRHSMYSVHIEKTNSLETIHSYDFTAIRRLRFLKLPYCNIKVIETNAFFYLNYLELIDLTGNQLQTLPATLFDSVMERRYLISVYLKANLWKCSCELIHIRQRLHQIEIEFAEFPSNCSASAQVLNNGEVKCGELSQISDHRNNGKFCKLEFLYADFPKIKIQLVNDQLTITAPKQIKEYFLIFIDGRNMQSELDCQLFRTRKSTVSVSHIKQHTMHTICFLESKTITRIWPMNCVTLCKVCDNWQKVWLQMHSLWYAIRLALFVTSFGIIVGVTLGFITVICYPKLLIGANRIVMLRNSGKRRERYTIFVMPHHIKNILDYR